jgi:general secretion pathway protein M
MALMIKHPMYRYLTTHPWLPGLLYLAAIVMLCLTTLAVMGDLVDRTDARNAASDAFVRLADRTQVSSAESQGIPPSWPPGSPFLEGQSPTLASAALLQRVTSAIAGAGGAVVSSEVEPQGSQPNAGYVAAIASFEIEQEALQPLLYDIEAGMPFLYIDQLSIQARESGHMRVLLRLSGLWRRGK